MLFSIPLVPRRPKSGEPGTGKGKDKKSDKKKDKTADPDKPDTPVPPSDPDEKVRQTISSVNISERKLCLKAFLGWLIVTFREFRSAQQICEQRFPAHNDVEKQITRCCFDKSSL